MNTIRVEPPRLDAYGRPIPDRFLIGVTVTGPGTLEELIEKAKADIYLNNKISEAAPHWKNTDPSAFMNEVRGRE